jgi:hypothetical protein
VCHLMCFKRSAGPAMRCRTHVQAWRMCLGRLGYSGFTAVNTNLLLLHICSPVFGLPFPAVWHVKDIAVCMDVMLLLFLLMITIVQLWRGSCYVLTNCRFFLCFHNEKLQNVPLIFACLTVCQSHMLTQKRPNGFL